MNCRSRARAEAFQDRKAEYHERHERQQGGVGQTHRPHADLARQPVAHDGGGIAQHAQYRAPRRAHAARFLEQSIFETFQQLAWSGLALRPSAA